MTTSERWILSEWRVAEDRRDRFGETLLAHRERTPFAEFDLLFSAHNRTATLIEVKTWSGAQWAQRPLNHRQEQRLIRTRAYLEARLAHPVKLILALVKYAGAQSEITYLDFPLEG